MERKRERKTDKRILELAKQGLSERKIADTIGTISSIAIHKWLVGKRDTGTVSPQRS